MSRRAQADDGTDITEGVQILYDIAHSSLDWGSGFLDNEEVEVVIDLAILMGWQVPDFPGSSIYRPDAPMVNVARRYPDHYTITARSGDYVSIGRKTKEAPATKR